MLGIGLPVTVDEITDSVAVFRLVGMADLKRGRQMQDYYFLFWLLCDSYQFFLYFNYYNYSSIILLLILQHNFHVSLSYKARLKQLDMGYKNTGINIKYCCFFGFRSYQLTVRNFKMLLKDY